jgi:hypothetical protein
MEMKTITGNRDTTSCYGHRHWRWLLRWGGQKKKNRNEKKLKRREEEKRKIKEGDASIRYEGREERKWVGIADGMLN